MKSKIKPKINSNRINLADVIPLQTPFTINIEPSDKCNFRCKFCPTSNIDVMKTTPGRNYGNINFDLYKKVINDILDFKDNIKILNLYKDGEPLLHPNFAEMVEYAKKSDKFDKIATTTNAYLLNKELSSKIIDAGIDRINISIEGINEEQYYNMSNVKINFNKLVKNIEYLYNNKKQCEIAIKTVGNELSEKDKEQFYKIFGDICDIIFIEYAVPIWNNFDFNEIKRSNISIFNEEILEYRFVCPQIFYTMAINSNGSVSPCCLDWSRNIIIGDANKEHLKDIWNGNKLRSLQLLHLKGDRKNHKYCASCDTKYISIDNLDNDMEKLFDKLQSRAEQSRALIFNNYCKKTA